MYVYIYINIYTYISVYIYVIILRYIPTFYIIKRKYPLYSVNTY